MNLTNYSDSESDSEAPPPVPKAAVKPAPKPAFQKVIDRANPGKIKLNLPSARQQPENDGGDSGEPPAKKARTRGGAFGIGGFLPAPKKADAKLTGNGGASQPSIGLKTSSEPSFLRDSNEVEDYDEEGNPIKRSQGASVTLNLRYIEETDKAGDTKTASQPKFEIPSGPVPAYMAAQMGRRKKKRPVPPRPAVVLAQGESVVSGLIATDLGLRPLVKPKVSLFSATQEVEDNITDQTKNRQYKPLLYGAQEDEEAPVPDDPLGQTEAYQQSNSFVQSGSHDVSVGSNNLSDIASELNLSAADKRRLFGGRRGQDNDLSTANVIDFNTDAEYAHNEMVRQQGDTAQHNALKSISGTGKNSLQSLIRNATVQKEALEDHFAQGKANKKAAGNRYGW
ncbi:hypothetical protein P154DRAFT_163845 [Amniculicola lignicola CBS 123094]|uniref:Mitotic checkpoint regulator, MAD2B-interacting-domain-containing protein n=1 Tax=Amniculicola lignicola CBS 123094 TaxID=1392246 RepID=A0A6A5WKE1_9PLEO|nr:hypothetical protein P154DRAFT_163845 [Amniculicola lignicola CBS 123094]